MVIVTTPVPICLAIFVLQLLVIGMRAMGFYFPPRIGLAFARPPAVIVGMRAIVITCMDGASRKNCRALEGSGKQNLLQMVS